MYISIELAEFYQHFDFRRRLKKHMKAKKVFRRYYLQNWALYLHLWLSREQKS